MAAWMLVVDCMLVVFAAELERNLQPIVGLLAAFAECLFAIRPP